jgi:hypothetical protein
VGNRCSTYFRLVWDPGITLSFNLVQLVDHRIVMALLEEKQYLGREDCNVPIFGFPYSEVVDDLMGLCQPDQRGNLRLTMNSRSLEELYDSFIGLLSYFIIRIIPTQSYFDSIAFRSFRNLGVLMGII